MSTKVKSFVHGFIAAVNPKTGAVTQGEVIIESTGKKADEICTAKEEIGVDEKAEVISWQVIEAVDI